MNVELRNKKNIKDQDDILQKKNILSMFHQNKTENAIIRMKLMDLRQEKEEH